MVIEVIIYKLHMLISCYIVKKIRIFIIDIDLQYELLKGTKRLLCVCLYNMVQRTDKGDFLFSGKRRDGRLRGMHHLRNSKKS